VKILNAPVQVIAWYNVIHGTCMMNWINTVKSKCISEETAVDMYTTKEAETAPQIYQLNMTADKMKDTSEQMHN
jgi:hypothetical protein